MALPNAYEPLSASMIMVEAGQSSDSKASLSGPTSTPAVGSMVKLYENATPTPVNQVAPHAYSEFYGKTFGGGGGFPGVAAYYITNANLDFEYDADDLSNNSITKNSFTGNGTYTAPNGSTTSLSVASLMDGLYQGFSLKSNIQYFLPTNGRDAFGNGQLWYTISGSGGRANNSDWGGGSGFLTIPFYRDTDLSIEFDFRDIDDNPSGIFSFDYDDTQYISVIFEYTASFKTGQNITCSMAVYSNDNPATAPIDLSGDWQILDPQDSQFAADNGVESNVAGEWHFKGELETTFYSELGKVYVKPVFSK
tara:strand:- start:1379 stop:2302 length:924 start_codon:yes stop_codon:yes gene_type:complete